MRLSAGLRRIVAILLLVAVLAALGLVAWWPFRHAEAQRQRLATIDLQIDELQGRIVLREQLLAEERILMEERRLEDVVIQAETPAIAAAELQGLIAGLLRAEGGTLESVSVEAPRQLGTFNEIRFTLRADLGIVELRHLLYSLETMKPIVLLESVRVAQVDDVDEPGRVAIELTVVAWMTVGDAAAQPPLEPADP